MDITGKVIAILPANSGVSQKTGNQWMTQQYVIETSGKYPKKMVFEIFGEDKIRQFAIQMGDDINVAFDIDASEYNGRWYNTIRAFNVVRVNNATTQQAPQPTQHRTIPQQPVPQQPPLFNEPTSGGNDDDLPF